MIEIRQAVFPDYEQIWEIIRPVIASGDTFAFDPETPKEKMLDYWCSPANHVYVALLEGKIAGTFVLKNNQPGLGSHIANASYMTHPSYSGSGIGKTMGKFSLDEARRLGYKAMQFNLVVKSNERALGLWTKLGFNIIAEIPEAFNHKIYGLTNAYIMYQKL